MPCILSSYDVEVEVVEGAVAVGLEPLQPLRAVHEKAEVRPHQVLSLVGLFFQLFANRGMYYVSVIV